MKIEYAPPGRMTQSGSALLRLLQNQKTPSLDLLVRESFQNSLDAGRQYDGNDDSVEIDIKTGSFTSEKLAVHLEVLEKSLRNRYPGEQTFIAIGDRNTCGLTGPLRFSDIGADGRYGNLLKLVYEISKPQDLHGAGGSWGLGKTVYFRVGIGLVLYYSRIRDRKGYQERLAATFVENETRPDRMLPKKPGVNIDRGIAWWGQKDRNSSDPDATMPLTDPDEIRKILQIFNIQQYKDEETGTVVIIPYTDEKKLLEETCSVDNNQVRPYWTQTDVAEYLRISSQRWYAPRLNNTRYPKKYGRSLKVRINDRMITRNEMAPVFRLVQSLYNAGTEQNPKFNKKPIVREQIRLNNVFIHGQFGLVAGHLNYIQVDGEDMRIYNPDNFPSPLAYIGHEKEEGGNPPILCFTRQPGMIVNYETTGKWLHGVNPSDNDKFIVALFVAESENRIAKTNDTLETYLRDSEKADHMEWEDGSDPLKGIPRMQIVDKIQHNCAKKLKESFNDSPASGRTMQRNAGLGRMLANFLLPPDNYAGWDDARGGGRGSGGSGGSGSPSGNSDPAGSSRKKSRKVQGIKFTGNPEYKGGEVSVPAYVTTGKSDNVIIRLYVTGDDTPDMSPSNWETNIGTGFPVKLKALKIKCIESGERNPRVLFRENRKLTGSRDLNGVEFKFLKSEVRGVTCGVKISAPGLQYTGIECEIVFAIDSMEDVSCGIRAEGEGGKS